MSFFRPAMRIFITSSSSFCYFCKHLWAISSPPWKDLFSLLLFWPLKDGCFDSRFLRILVLHCLRERTRGQKGSFFRFRWYIYCGAIFGKVPFACFRTLWKRERLSDASNTKQKGEKILSAELNLDDRERTVGSGRKWREGKIYGDSEQRFVVQFFWENRRDGVNGKSFRSKMY